LSVNLTIPKELENISKDIVKEEKILKDENKLIYKNYKKIKTKQDKKDLLKIMSVEDKLNVLTREKKD
jgi:ribonucleotide reductase beta subunit family protein with ferritin-like domain